jgi:ribonucleoside-diphosphate reductase alpha chain
MVPDLFMRRVEENGTWSLMSRRMPGAHRGLRKGLTNSTRSNEADGKFRRQVPASELFSKIVDAQIETGTPYAFQGLLQLEE